MKKLFKIQNEHQNHDKMIQILNIIKRIYIMSISASPNIVPSQKISDILLMQNAYSIWCSHKTDWYEKKSWRRVHWLPCNEINAMWWVTHLHYLHSWHRQRFLRLQWNFRFWKSTKKFAYKYFTREF